MVVGKATELFLAQVQEFPFLFLFDQVNNQWFLFLLQIAQQSLQICAENGRKTIKVLFFSSTALSFHLELFMSDWGSFGCNSKKWESIGISQWCLSHFEFQLISHCFITPPSVWIPLHWWGSLIVFTVHKVWVKLIFWSASDHFKIMCISPNFDCYKY